MKVAAAFIENEAGELLLGLRPEGKAFAGHWEFPGGKLEADESAFAALERELKEELHLDVRLVEDFDVYRFSGLDGSEVELHFFRVRALGVPKRTSANREIKWMRAEAALSLTLVPADVKPLKDYIARVSILPS